MKPRVLIASLGAGILLAGTWIWQAEARTAPPVSQTENAPARHAFEVAMNLRQSTSGAAASARRPIATDQFRSGGGWADHFKYTRNQRIDAQHVSLAGSYRARSTVYVPGKDGQLIRADPTGVLDFTAQMDRDPATGDWTVASFSWDFAPGSEP